MKINNSAFVFFILMALLGWVFILASCQGNGPPSNPNTPPALPEIKNEQKSVSDSAKTVGVIGKDIGLRAEKIDTHAAAIEDKTPPDAKAAVQPEVDGIKSETRSLRQNSATLSATEQKLKDTETRLSDQQKNIEKYAAYTKDSEVQRTKLQDKIKELESSNAKILKTMMSWVTVCCVIGIGVSLAIGFFFKTPAAFMVAAGCVATMGVAVAVTLYLQQIAWVALALLGVGFVAAVVYVFMQIKSRDTAVKELIHTGEIAKTYLPITAREKIFGNAVEPGVANQVQSDSTIKIVSNVRRLDKSRRGYGLAPEIITSDKTDTHKPLIKVQQGLHKAPDSMQPSPVDPISPKTIIG